METVFFKLVNLGLVVGWLILAILIIRLLLRTMPKWVCCALWGLVALRLICPIPLESTFSLIPSAEPIPQESIQTAVPQIDSGVSVLDEAINPLLSESMAPDPGDSADPAQVWSFVLARIWVAGAVLLLLYGAGSYWALRRQVSTATILQPQVKQSEWITSPFVLGLWRPVIYLPYQITAQDRTQVIAHEQAHIQRKDHWWKLFGFVLLAVYWFQPLLWGAYILFCRDVEAACDEKVIGNMTEEERRTYAAALFHCSTRRRPAAACPLAFGETGVKTRIRHILHYQKPGRWIIGFAGLLALVLAICFLTLPAASHDSLKLTSVTGSAHIRSAEFEVQLGTEIGGGEIFVEQWSYGECVRSAPVPLTFYAKEIHCRATLRTTDSEWEGVDIQIETDQYGGSLLTYFAFPENASVIGWSFSSYQEGERIPVTPDTSSLLAVMAFDTGEGILQSFTPRTLQENPDLLAEAAYLIVLRAVFYETTLLPQESAPDSTEPAQVLTIEDILRLSQEKSALRWSSLDHYFYEESGSGLYIRIYETNGPFSLLVGADSPESDPLYFRLYAQDGSGDSVDIQEEDLVGFLEKHQPPL